ncbi:HNH endonuclease family protein [Pseudoclavibacter helvolus]
MLPNLESIVATDSEFEASFSVARVTKTSLSRYYLLALESHATSQHEPELVPNKDEEAVNLEHVLPKNSSRTEWPKFTEEDSRQWADRLGNHALLQKSKNNRIGNKAFSIKKPILEKSSFNLTRSVGEKAAWTSTEIEERQKSMAASAPKVWPRNL